MSNNELGPLPKVHPRHVPVEQARRELQSFLIGLREKYNLTASEEMALLADSQADLAHACVRGERRETHKS